VSLVILRAGVDTVEVSLMGELCEGRTEELDRLKAFAQDKNEAQRLGDTPLFVQPKAYGFWRWRLTTPLFELRLSPCQDKGKPSASVRLSALGLASHDPLELYRTATEQLASLGEYFECGVSRLDVYADLQGWTPTVAELRGMKCPATFRPIYPNVEHPETFQYGKGDVVVRLYNKDAEILHSHKPWVRETWRESGRWDPEQPVWRIEVQARTKLLGELRQRSASVALARPGAVFDYVLRKWCQLRVPNGDQKVTRWLEHPVWAELRGLVFDGETAARVLAKSRLLPLEGAAKRVVGLVATAGAYYGEVEYIKALQRLSDRAEVYMLSEHVEFGELVAEKYKRLQAEIGDDWDEVPF
jgi:hypothetical protein